MRTFFCCALFALAGIVFLVAGEAGAAEQKSIEPAPPRAEGDGPYPRLILRGLTVINGTGAPARGPMDIVIEGNRITRVSSVGNPGLPINDDDRPQTRPGDKVIDLDGMYALPGFVDMHGHIGGVDQGTPAEYVFKLWLGHGITTVRDPASGNGVEWVVAHKQKSARNAITAPRIEAYVSFGQGRDEPIATPRQARQWVAEQAKKGADGLKFFGARPDILRAALEEARKQGLRTAMHHAQLEVARANVLDTSGWGLTTMEHWYGLPEALFDNRTVQDYPADYNYNDEQHRFGEAGRLWSQAAGKGSERWNLVRNTLIERDFTIDPTLTIYEASRDLMAQRRAEWHEDYTLPSLWDFFAPSRDAHGSYWFDWTTADEIAWKNNFRKWMQFLNDYKNHGGRVTAGSDSGYIYKIYGFGYIQELELLQEAGFHPLEVIRAATLHGAQALGLESEIGSLEVGKLADLVIVDENPLANFKVLYGTGALRVDSNNQPVRVGGVVYTIKDGIVYDAGKLRADVRKMVDEAWTEADRTLTQPGVVPTSR
ncbi:MAG: amidohydrolase family protein [Gammaproteobacteria bacterium]|nr:amidohydrolase family protein [Gammaproteobacteria bacterium]